MAEVLPAMREMTDEELAAHIDSPGAFAELESRYLRLIGSAARKIKYPGSSAPEDDDLIQEGLMGLYEAAVGYQPAGKAGFRTYASVCISNRLKNLVRSHGRKKHLPLNDSVPLEEASRNAADPSSSPELQLENRETFEAVARQIHTSLTEFERKCLAYYLSGCKRSEIARNLGVSPKAFDNALQRVRRKLKAYSSSR